MVDELAWWALGHTGGEAITPNIDRLAERSKRFHAAYTPCPMCVPARAAIATGRYVHETGYWSSAQAYDGGVPSWGHSLQQMQVPVRSFGKLHYVNALISSGFDAQHQVLHIKNGVGWVQGLLRRPLCSYSATQTLATDIGVGHTDYTDFDERVVASFSKWHSEKTRFEEWAAFVSLLTPHYPFIAPEKYYELYDPLEYESEAEATPDHPILREMAQFFDNDAHFTAETRGIARAAYYGLCSFMDEEVGRVLDSLEQKGELEETLVIFTSDHGEMLGEKGHWGKEWMYDSSVRVPLLLSGPDIEEGDWYAPVSLIDIAPTIANNHGAQFDGSGR